MKRIVKEESLDRGRKTFIASTGKHSQANWKVGVAS